MTIKKTGTLLKIIAICAILAVYAIRYGIELGKDLYHVVN